MMPTLLEQYQADLAYLNAKKDSLVEARGSKLAERAGHAADAAAILEQFVTSNDTAGQQNLVGQDAIAFVNEKIRLTNSRINDIPEAQQRKAFQFIKRLIRLTHHLFNNLRKEGNCCQYRLVKYK